MEGQPGEVFDTWWNRCNKPEFMVDMPNTNTFVDQGVHERYMRQLEEFARKAFDRGREYENPSKDFLRFVY